jgi:hypothetical protein
LTLATLEAIMGWEEKHDPKIVLDFEVMVSCLLFFLVSASLYLVGNLYGSFLFLVVTIMSTLADSVYVNHQYVDIADRITATCGALYMLWFTTQWFIAHQDWTQYLVWIKIISQALSGMTPFKYLEQCRAFAVRSENWRKNHIMWHITGTGAMVFSIYVSHGYLDSTFDSLLDHLEPYVGKWIDVEPLVANLAFLQDTMLNTTA